MPQTDRAAHAQDDPTGEAARFRGSPFYAALQRALARRGMRAEELCDCGDPASRRLLSEYGAMFVAADGVRVPSVLTFRSEEGVEQFQRAADVRAAVIGGAQIELQPAALDALLAACDDARAEGLEITPRGAVAARRGYADTVRLWDSRVRPALEHWLGEQKLGREEAECLRCMEPAEQLSEVLRLEARGLFFSTDWTKTILQSVAAPGASQHLAMLAFDAAEFTNARVRELFARRGWFQTVLSDLPHFTFLGVREKDLPTLGLRRVEECGQTFWVPDLG
ncbi:MAG: hypothetical protein LC785_13675 [Acidobacteria bacterium]|nr:hypothetical protein [Acidobacteriota bacterium]MCA1642965.1 hypothetical protein [Acidobacteriota bacterium]